MNLEELQTSSIDIIRAAHETGGLQLMGKNEYLRDVRGAIRVPPQHLWMRCWFDYRDLVQAIGSSEVERLLAISREYGRCR